MSDTDNSFAGSPVPEIQNKVQKAPGILPKNAQTWVVVIIAAAMIVTYLLWAVGEHAAWLRGWHVASAVPLSLALARFDRLTAQPTTRSVEDLLTRDPNMVTFEMIWLLMFCAGLLG